MPRLYWEFQPLRAIAALVAKGARRFHWSYRRNGLVPTLARVPRVVLRRGQVDERWRAYIRDQDGSFDEEFGVDTAGLVKLRDLAISGENWTHGVDYQAISAGLFQDMMDRLQINHEQYVFIDLGSGKGKALLLAAAYPFQKIIGVEFSPELTEVARRNIERYSGPRRCFDIEAVCSDAALYPLPDQPLVIFLYNPFDEPVMRAVLRNLEDRLPPGTLATLIVYYNPRLRDLFSEPRFRVVSDVPAGDGYVIYELATNSAAIVGSRDGS